MSKPFLGFALSVSFLCSLAAAQPASGKVSCAGSHCLWLDPGGEVRSWGKNEHGELGSGALKQPPSRDEAGLVALPRKAVDVAAGYWFSLALLDDGSVVGWGQNNRGQLGAGPARTEDSPLPIPAVGLRDVRQIAAGYSWAMALDKTGAVWQWGGLPDQHGSVNAPARVAGLESIRRIAAGHSFGLALRDDGTLFCWGSNRRGQCGDGTIDPRPTPVAVTGLDGPVKAMAGAESTAFALMEDGTLRVWGSNTTGLILNGQKETCNEVQECYTRPRPAPGIRNAVHVAAGVGHCLVLLQDGSLRGWGHNGFGEVGDGTAGNYRFTAAVVAKVPPLQAVWAGGYRSVGLTRDGKLIKWGWVHSQQATPTSKLHSPTPLPVPLLDAVAVSDAAATAAVDRRSDATFQATVLDHRDIDESAVLADAREGRAQWAVAATASSEYAPDKYNARQAAGAPDVPAYGDDARAWCPMAAERSPEWLELQYAKPAQASEVRVRQTFTPGSIVKVEAFEPDGAAHVLWEGRDGNQYPPGQIVWFVVRFPLTPYKIHRLRLTLDTPSLKGWKEIDAVQLF